MPDRTAPRARRRAVVDEPLLTGERFDYADAFEVRVREPDDRTAEQWARAGLEQAPPPVRWAIVVAHRTMLGLRLGPLSSPDHVLGWRVVTSQPDVVRLEAAGPLLRGVIVGRRVDRSCVVLTTIGVYRRPAAARLVWALVGPLHRMIAPYLLERAATTGEPGRTATPAATPRAAARQSPVHGRPGG